MKDPERIFIVIFIIVAIPKVVSTAVPALLTQRSPENHLCSHLLILATGTLAESHSSYLAQRHSTPTAGFLSGARVHLKSFSMGGGEISRKPCCLPVPKKAPPGGFHDRKERRGKRCSGFTTDVSGSLPAFPFSCVGPHSERDRKVAECESPARQHSL